MTAVIDVKNISVATAKELAEIGLGEVIDVREGWELEFEACVPNAYSMPLTPMKLFSGESVSPEMLEAMEEMAVDVPTLIKMLNTHREKGSLLMCLCRSGNRSKDAVRLLKSLGYTNVVNIDGGIRAWEEAGFTTYRKIDA